MTQMKYDGQCILVTGAGGSIGRAIAGGLSREGASLVLADLGSEPLRRTHRTLAHPKRAIAVMGDITNDKDVERLVTTARRFAHRIDALVHAAGVAKFASLLKTTHEVWEETLRVNLHGSYLVSKRVAQEMIHQRSGRILLLASTNAFVGEPELAAYNASKAGVVLLARTMARELGSYGICVNVLAPGFICTGLNREVWSNPRRRRAYERQVPLRRLGRPADVVGPALFLLSKEAQYISGHALVVDGGQLA